MLPHQMFGGGFNQIPESSHGHKSGHKRKELTRGQSNPAMGSVVFESVPLPRMTRQLSSSASMEQYSRGGSTDQPTTSSQSGGKKQTSAIGNHGNRALWSKDWKPGKLVCAVPKLYQPTVQPKSTGEVTANIKTAMDFPRDQQGSNLPLHCIDLQAYDKRIKSLVTDFRSRIFDTVSVPDPPIRFHNPSSATLPKRGCSDTPPNPIAAVELGQGSLHQLLRKATAATCACTGYDETSSQALDALSTVLRDYLTNFTKLLRNNYDLALENGGTAFTDVLDQSLHQSGVEGKRGLDKYWQDSVKGLFRYLEDEVCESTHELLRLSKQPSTAPQFKRTDRTESPTLWPPSIKAGDANEQAISLEAALESADMDNVLPMKTPDLDGPAGFAHFADQAVEDGDSEDFASLGLEGPPPTKRLRTFSFGD